MKVCIIGSAHKKTRTEYYIRRAFERSGRQVYWFSGNRKKGLFRKTLEDRFLQYIQRIDPDFLLVTKARDLSSDVVGKACHGRPSAMWYFDAREKIPESVLSLASAVGTLFLTNRGQLDVFRKEGVRKALFLPQACDVQYHCIRHERKKKRWPVSFIGGTRHSAYRKGILSELGRAHAIHVWGKGNDAISDVFVHRKAIFNSRLVNVVGESEIVLGLNSWESLNALDSYGSNRIWLTMGCGGFFLGYRTPNIDDVVPGGKYCDYYESKEELLEKIGYYLNNSAVREKIRNQAYAWAHQYHTYDQRIHNLLAFREYALCKNS